MHRVRLARHAERGLRSIRLGDPGGYRRIVAAVRALADDPRPPSARKLTAVDPPAWRLRLGGYRVVYEVDDTDLIVTVVNVAPRGEIYR